MIPVYRWNRSVAYVDACARQEACVDESRESLILCEHAPTITKGTSATPDDLAFPDEYYRRQGIELFKSPRGGKTTYHGPGQLVCYPILNIRQRNVTIHAYLRFLEEVMIELCRVYGFSARRIEGKAGAWVEDRKIGFIGVRVRRGFTFHGFSFNITPQHDPFRLIVPCGMPDLYVTSLEEETRRKHDLWSVSEQVEAIFSERLAVLSPSSESAPYLDVVR